MEETGTAATIGLGDFRSSDTLGRAPSRISEAAALSRITTGFSVPGVSGATVKFGTVCKSHITAKNDQRARFLPSAEACVRTPVEVWQEGLRRRYLCRFKGNDGKMHGFLVVTARKGEHLDEVITFFPKSGRALKALREGELIYRK